MLWACYAAAYLGSVSTAPAPNKWDFKSIPTDLSCRVLAVSKSAIAVASLEDAINGYKLNQVLTFPFHYRLAYGSFNQLEVFDRRCYTRDDLRAGDRIDLYHMVVKNKITYCISICIRERPGGAVPPSRRYRVGDFQPHHECANAYAAERNDKTPLPRHLVVRANAADYPAFDPSVPRKDRIAAWPSKTPFSYMEYLLFMR